MKRAAAVATLALIVAGASACAPGGRAVAPPPLAPRFDQPALTIPADLDLVVRVDLKRLRAVLGLEGGAVLDELTRHLPAEEPDRDTAALTRRLFSRAETLWIAARPGLAPELTDSVVVLRGDFRGQVPSALGGSPAWRAAQDLGGDVRRFERPPPALRSAPAVLYVQGGSVAVLGSTAEIDALERTIEQGKVDAAVRAPEAGIVTFAARLTDLTRRLRERAPTVAGILRGAESIEGSVDHAVTEFRFRVDVHFAGAPEAEAGARALRGVLGALAGPERPWLSRVRLDALGSDLSLKVDLEAAELSRAARCWQRADC